VSEYSLWLTGPKAAFLLRVLRHVGEKHAVRPENQPTYADLVRQTENIAALVARQEEACRRTG